MSAATGQIQSAIEALALDDMLTIHEGLIGKIHEKAEQEGLEPSFRAEIERRLKEIEAGTAKGVEAFEALSKM